MLTNSHLNVGNAIRLIRPKTDQESAKVNPLAQPTDKVELSQSKPAELLIYDNPRRFQKPNSVLNRPEVPLAAKESYLRLNAEGVKVPKYERPISHGDFVTTVADKAGLPPGTSSQLRDSSSVDIANGLPKHINRAQLTYSQAGPHKTADEMLKGYIGQSYIQGREVLRDAIKEAKDGKAQVVNMSFGWTDRRLAGILSQASSPENPNQKLRDDAQRLLKELEDPNNPGAHMGKITQYISELRQNDPGLKLVERSFRSSLSQAEKAGLNVVIAAGNSGNGATQDFLARPNETMQLVSNGAYQNHYSLSALGHGNAVSAGATRKTGSYGHLPANYTSPGPAVDVSAQGNWAIEHGGKLHYGTGTSYSAPHLSTQLLKIRQQNPDLSPSEAVGELYKKSTPNPNSLFLGRGVIQ